VKLGIVESEKVSGGKSGFGIRDSGFEQRWRQLAVGGRQRAFRRHR
jgi:hypothetical protein